ncbi:MAG TPA: translation initiation factor IF-2 [Bacilli bacterium]|nr:translation initiation factor IF-2 [Bacilli bacterium]
MSNLTRISNTTSKKTIGPIARLEGKTLFFSGPLTVVELAKFLKVNEAQIIKNLFLKGHMVTINNQLDADLVGEVCIDLNYDFNFEEVEASSGDDFNISTIKDDKKDLEDRPPVVTIMGHVDHGKTTLIDRIRSSNIAGGEAGAITQAIGAYQKEVKGRKITFIDTPGHEAFTAMRSRGASVTDIVILVVAADDGVMPQTKEAIDHALAANVPIIVAVNKIDKPGVDPSKVKGELLALNVVAEEYGGEVIFQHISAKTGQGIEELLEAVILQAEMLELKANPNRYAYGTVLEAKIEKGEGPKASLLLQNGTLTNQDYVVAGSAFGKIRRLTNEYNKVLKSAGPATPVQIIGLDEAPEAGDIFMAFESEKEAKEIAMRRKQLKIRASRVSSGGLKLSDLAEQIKDGETVNVNVIIKADNQGSAEAVKSSLGKIDIKGVTVTVIRASAGTITENDITLARASNAIVYGFSVRPTAQVRDLAEREGVDIRLHRIIYALIEETELAMKGLLKPVMVERVTGQAEVRAIWKVTKIGTIAGSYVTSGVLKRDQKCRLLRDGLVIYEGSISSMKHGTNDAKESQKGFECGMTLTNYNDIHENDIIEGFEMVEKK